MKDILVNITYNHNKNTYYIYIWLSVNIADVTPKTTLLQYLRDFDHLKGTKYMCLEGGCGACIVSVTAKHPITKRNITFAVNSVNY